MSLLDELAWRDFLHQTTHDDLDAALEKQSVKVYAGFDPTADSLHVGSMVPIMGLARFQRAGHTPIALVGGGTGLIGDPSGKASERTLLSREDVERNCAGIRENLERFLDFSGSNAAILMNNADWLCEINLLDFLRDVGKHFSVNAMLQKDSVRNRLQDRDQGISYTEFTYSLLQAYDFLHLCRAHDCQLQIGGSDQWGNIVAGMDLTRRLLQKETWGVTFPLVTKADGSKFGKSESGNIWLDAERTSPYRFFQFWLNQADADVVRYLKFFTFLSREEIDALEQEVVDAPHQRAAQKRLAEEVTRMVHGDDALTKAQQATQALFGGDLRGLDEATLTDIFQEAPSSEVPRQAIAESRPLLEVLVEAEVFSSKGEARRMVKNGGLYLNGDRVEADDAKLGESSRLTEGMAIVRKGKKNYHLLRFV